MNKVVKILGMVLVISIAFSANAQTTKQEQKQEKQEVKAQKKQQKEVKSDLYKKPEKDARKEAKKLAKAGWKTMGLPIDKQIEDAWLKQYEKDASGYPRYIMVTTQVVANNVSAAQMQAENLAKVRIAGTIQTNVASLVDMAVANQEISQVEAASITKVVENSKNIVAQKLGRVVKVLEIYRQKPNNNVEVRIGIVYDMKAAMSVARQVALDELKKDLDINRAKLEQMMGMDKMMENSKVIVPDEIVE
jgi:sensor domain CHASE-containing protein